MRGIIYCRTNTINGKQYIGQTQNELSRQHHWNNLNLPYSGNLINNARKKYGLSAFTYSILFEYETDSKEKLKTVLDFWERTYINLYNTKAPNGYNLTDGGDGVNGYKQTKEQIRKRTIKNKGKKRTKEFINNLIENHPTKKTVYQYTLKGNLINVYKTVMSTENNGYSYRCVWKCCTNERKTYKNFVWSFNKLEKEYFDKINNNNHIKGQLNKKVYQYSEDGELIKLWNNAKECKKFGFTPSAISLCCNGKRNKHKGFIWSFTQL